MSVNIKKIGYLTLIGFVIASTIGAGIFFKNQQLNNLAQGQLGLVIAVWIVASVGIIALAIALLEVAANQLTNQGILEWTKHFTSNWFNSSSINYIKFFYNPINMFVMPIYAVMSFQDAGLFLPNGWGPIVFALFIFLFFSFLNLISFNLSALVQKIITVIKFIPLIILPIFAFINTNNFSDGNTILQKTTSSLTGLNGLSPYLVLISGLPAITFAFDGFYSVASLRNESANQKKNYLALTVGLFIIMTAYLYVTIAFNLGSNNGTHNGIQPWFFSKKTWIIIIKISNFLIGISIIGIMNGYSLSSPRQLVDLMDDEKANFLVHFKILFFRKLHEFNCKKQKYFSAWFFYVTSSLLFYLVFGLIGALAYGGVEPSYNFYGFNSGGVYAITDLLTNYTSMIIFVIIATAVFGRMIIGFKKKFITKKIKSFYFFASISVLMMFSGFAYTLIAGFVDMFGVNNANQSHAITRFLVYLVFLIGSTLIPTINFIYQKIKKHKKDLITIKLPNEYYLNQQKNISS